MWPDHLRQVSLRGAQHNKSHNTYMHDNNNDDDDDDDDDDDERGNTYSYMSSDDALHHHELVIHACSRMVMAISVVNTNLPLFPS
jgi:hypothetical protein